MLLLLVLFSGIDRRSSKLSNMYLCAEQYVFLCILGGAGGVAGGATVVVGGAFGTEAKGCFL